MKKKIAVLLMAAMGTSMLAGCGGTQGGTGNAETQTDAAAGEETGEQETETTEAQSDGQGAENGQVELTFMGWGKDSEVATFRAMIAAYEDKYPNVKVDYVVVANSDYDTKMQNMIAAGEQPDAFYCGIDYVMKYAATGNLYDLSSYVENNDLFDVDNVC